VLAGCSIDPLTGPHAGEMHVDARIREWLKTLRKKNVSVVFATQSLADIERSTIAPALIESCPTRIFLPNDRALEPQARAVYERFGLNARQAKS
jgi:type IV secretion system protein TrbE